jgi:hypothetical protein
MRLRDLENPYVFLYALMLLFALVIPFILIDRIDHHALKMIAYICAIIFINCI